MVQRFEVQIHHRISGQVGGEVPHVSPWPCPFIVVEYNLSLKNPPTLTPTTKQNTTQAWCRGSQWIAKLSILYYFLLFLNKERRHCHLDFGMWSGKINMLLFYVSYDLWFVTSLLHYFSHVPSADTCNIIVFYQSTVTNNTTVIMFSTVRNNAYSEHVMEIMTQGLRKVCKNVL